MSDNNQFGIITTTSETRLGRMLAAGRLTATMQSKRSGDHITITLSACAKLQNKWQHVPFAEATHVFIAQGPGGYGAPKVGTYYPKTGKLYFNRGFDSPAWQFAVRHILHSACTGQQDTDLYTIQESNLCGKCGKELTDPVSIARGIGPTCYGASTESHHYRQTETVADATQERVREVTQRPSSVPGNRPITTEVVRDGEGNTLSVSQHGGTMPEFSTDKKGRNVPRTFEALAAAVKETA